jgi:malate permease and related proteins
MLEPVLAAVIPVLVTAGIGFAWVRSGRSVESKVLSPLVMDLGTPCLIISTLTRAEIAPEAVAATAAATLCTFFGFALLAALVLPLLKLPLRTYLPCIAFPNAGNLGLPVALYAFGPEGLSYAIVFFAICSVANYTVGQAISAGVANWRVMLRLPIVHAALLGMLGSLFHVQLPPWLANTLSLLGGLTVPLMLLMLGASLATLRITRLGPALIVTILRIGGGFAIGLGVTWLFGLGGAARAALVIQSAMPVAVLNYLFALRWDNRPEEVAGAVVLSTFASILTVPLLLQLLLS